jgi:hypothetical protein
MYMHISTTSPCRLGGTKRQYEKTTQHMNHARRYRRERRATKTGRRRTRRARGGYLGTWIISSSLFRDFGHFLHNPHHHCSTHLHSFDRYFETLPVCPCFVAALHCLGSIFGLGIDGCALEFCLCITGRLGVAQGPSTPDCLGTLLFFSFPPLVD